MRCSILVNTSLNSNYNKFAPPKTLQHEQKNKKNMLQPNALAYFIAASVAKKEHFSNIVTRDQFHKTFLSVLYKFS
jgi:hypothetical protein